MGNVDHVLFCIHDLSNEFLSVKFLKSLNNNPPHTSEVLPHWTKTTEYQPTESDSLPMIFNLFTIPQPLLLIRSIMFEHRIDPVTSSRLFSKKSLNEVRSEPYTIRHPLE